VQCATFSKSVNPRNIGKSVSDIRIRIRFPFESSFWISVSGCKLTILSDIQPANRIVIISGAACRPALLCGRQPAENSSFSFGNTPLQPARYQAKFLTCKISDFTPCTHAQSNILHAKYVDKTNY